MFKKILLASDGSPSALRAVDVAIEYMKKFPDAKVDLIYVVAPFPTHWSVHYPKFNEDLDNLIQETGERALQSSLDRFKHHHITVESLIKYGDPAEEIKETAEEGKYDLIIIGRRGLSPVKELALGSLSHKICRIAACPVLVVNESHA